MMQWTPELLNAMRNCGDELADATLKQAEAVPGEVSRISAVFQNFSADDAAVPADAPPELLNFIAATRDLPAGLDLPRIERGALVLLDNSTLCALALLLKSLPDGYAAPRLSTILHKTKNLEKRPYKRALGVLQMLVNITRADAFAAGGRAQVTAQKMRLLHAGVRHVVRHRMPHFEGRFGMPVSQLDMVFTAMTFSIDVIDGLAALGAKLSDDDAEDYFYLWRVYGQLQGIRPEWMPGSLQEGRTFCQAYSQEFRSAADNPQGVALTLADLDMLRGLVPWPLRMLGLGMAPRVYLLKMLGDEAAARVGVERTTRHALMEWIILKLPVIWHRFWNAATPDHEVHARVSRLFFSVLIDQAWGQAVEFSVPDRMRDLRKLA